MPQILLDNNQVNPFTARQQAFQQGIGNIAGAFEKFGDIQEKQQQTARQQAVQVLDVAQKLQSQGVALDEQAFKDIEDAVYRGDISSLSRPVIQPPSELEKFSAGRNQAKLPLNQYYDQYKKENPNTRMKLGPATETGIQVYEDQTPLPPTGLRGAFQNIGNFAAEKRALEAEGQQMDIGEKRFEESERNLPFRHTRKAEEYLFQERVRQADPYYQATLKLAGARGQSLQRQNQQVPLSVSQKAQMTKLAGNVGTYYGIIGDFDASLNQLKDPNINYDSKIKIGQQLLKTINAMAGGLDAVGAEEVRRLGSFLEYKLGNITDPGSFVGRDLPLFIEQIELSRKRMEERINSAEKAMKTLESGGQISDALRPRSVTEGITGQKGGSRQGMINRLKAKGYK
jgi:hypothetical protein